MTPQALQALYESLFDNAFDGLAYCQMIFNEQRYPIDFMYVRVNKNFGALTGLRGAEGKKITELIPGIATSNPELFEICGKVSVVGAPEQFETYIEPLSRWFSISVYCPQKKFFVAIFQNITRRKEVEGDLEKAKVAARNVLEDLQVEKDRAQQFAKELEKFKLAVNGVSEHIIITDRDGAILFVNPAAERITGFTENEIIGKKVDAKELWGGLMDKEFYDRLWNTIKIEKKSFSGEVRNRSKDGREYYAHTTISPILDQQGEVEFFIGIERDVTKEKELDRAKSEFISIASHQLRTPLTGIQWVVERFTKKEKLTERGKEYLDDIHVSVKRLTELIDLLLNLSRIEAGRFEITPEPLEVIGFVKSFLGEYGPLFDKKELRIVFEDHPAELKVNTDKKALGNIIQSLVSNAIEYTPNKGKITIATQKKGDAFVIAIRDTGIGIPPLEQSQIFGKFVRATNAKLYRTNGTGIGLYIADRATNFLGGKIWFESPSPISNTVEGVEESCGSTFYVELPITLQPKKEGGGLPNLTHSIK